jgi:hypothetical protein
MSKAKSRTTPNRAPRQLLQRARLITLSPAELDALEEMCTLSAHTMGFSYSPAMERVVRAIADKAGPAMSAREVLVKKYVVRLSAEEREQRAGVAHPVKNCHAAAARRMIAPTMASPIRSATIISSRNRIMTRACRA